VKNLNSFRSAEKAIEYEIKRQIEVLESGGKVVQETRGFDESKQATFSQRSKEDSHDYRYFPDPDLPKLDIREIAEFSKEALFSEIKETPNSRREKLTREYSIKESDIEFYINNSRMFYDLFIEAVSSLKEKGGKDVQLLSNYIVSDFVGILQKLGTGSADINGSMFADLIVMIEKGELSSRGAKDTLAIMVEKGGNPQEIALSNNFIQKNDKEEIKAMIIGVLEANPTIVDEYKGGKVSSLQFLIGQVMKASKGSGNPNLIKEILLDQLA
jgi:aspartyl-tRNA(Asn)/glutamyl-tRNA(Gln) amidotransferase subunit B